jgi:hypothetical protein
MAVPSVQVQSKCALKYRLYLADIKQNLHPKPKYSYPGTPEFPKKVFPGANVFKPVS